MFWVLVAFVVGALVTGFLLTRWTAVGGPGRYSTLGDVLRPLRRVWVPAIGAIAAAAVIFKSVIVIDAGTVGVVKRLGAVKGEIGPGLHLIVPVLDKVVVYPTIKKTYEASEEPDQSRADYPDVIISALTSDGQQIKVGITARFMIQPGKAPWILQNLGTEEEYVEKIVKTEIRGSGRRVPTKYASYDLYTRRSYEAQQALYDEIAPKFQANGLILDELVLRNITFTPEYAKVLEDKQIALENITTEKNKLEQEKIRREQKIVSAEAEARSIEIRQAALAKNPTIIQWEFVQKLAPNIQWGVLPQGAIPLLNLQTPQK